jgi:hypothetical protein
MILTPRVVWQHTLGPKYRQSAPQTRPQTRNKSAPDQAQATLAAPVKYIIEASICRGGQLDGRTASGHFAHGVYEGSYFQLLRDAEDLLTVLTKLASAPPLIKVPPLQLPAAAPAPTWNDFKPTLQPVPQCALLPELILPYFREPHLPVSRRYFNTCSYPC